MKAFEKCWSVHVVLKFPETHGELKAWCEEYFRKGRLHAVEIAEDKSDCTGCAPEQHDCRACVTDRENVSFRPPIASL